MCDHFSTLSHNSHCIFAHLHIVKVLLTHLPPVQPILHHIPFSIFPFSRPTAAAAFAIKVLCCLHLWGRVLPPSPPVFLLLTVLLCVCESYFPHQNCVRTDDQPASRPTCCCFNWSTIAATVSIPFHPSSSLTSPPNIPSPPSPHSPVRTVVVLVHPSTHQLLVRSKSSSSFLSSSTTDSRSTHFIPTTTIFIILPIAAHHFTFTIPCCCNRRANSSCRKCWVGCGESRRRHRT